MSRSLLSGAAHSCVGLAAIFSILLLSDNRSDGGPLLESFVMTVGGQSNYHTYSAPEPVYTGFFATSPGVSIPSNGSYSDPTFLAPTGIAGSWRKQSATSGTLSDSMSVNTTFNSGANSFVGTAAAQAEFGKLAVEAHGTLTGPSNGSLVDGSESFALFRESMTFFSPTIVNDPNNANLGYARYSFTIDGSLISTGGGTADIEALYKQGTNPTYTLMRAQVDSRFGTFISGATVPAAISNASAYGFTSSIGTGTASLSGSGVFKTYFEPFTIGTSVDFTIGMLAFGIPAADGTTDASFFSTARLTGIEIVDRFGRPITDFTISSGSGTLYDADGAHPASPIPEPSSAILAMIGCAVAATSRVLRLRSRLVA